ncbi:MAG: aldo/keto reductase [Fimbriimonadaceae bacterium]|nr:aldo/keto reductase [Fimbriimonadaceae bacterium]
MQYTNLGRSGLKVSRLCLGTMNFGPKTTEPDSFAIMDRALELGINFFDTADVYGWDKTGWTERIIGNWFAQGNQRREKTVIATKVYGIMGDWPNDEHCSALHIRRACEASLQRMQTDYIDLYQMHHIDRGTPTDEILEAFSVLRQQGKVLYFGSSNFAGWHIARFNETAKARHQMGLISEQCVYNLLNRKVESEVIPAAREYGLGIIPWSPLAGGVLAGPSDDPGARRNEGWGAKSMQDNADQIGKWVDLCRELGETPGNAALAWTLHQPGVTGPIIGPRTMAQLDDATRALEIQLSADVLAQINEIFPGRKTSPEEHAW